MNTTVVIISEHPQRTRFMAFFFIMVFNMHQILKWPEKLLRYILAEQHFNMMANYDDDSCMIIGVCEEISWQKKPGGRLPGVRLQHETQICRLRIKQISHKRFVGIENSANPKSKY